MVDSHLIVCYWCYKQNKVYKVNSFFVEFLLKPLTLLTKTDIYGHPVILFQKHKAIVCAEMSAELEAGTNYPHAEFLILITTVKTQLYYSWVRI